jgi:hypothetical protein
VQDVKDWITQVEDDEGQRIDVLVIDYADKMVSSNEKDNSYVRGREVYEGLRHWMVERKTWCWTASQVKRKEKGRAKEHVHDTDDVSDSKEKSRVVDLQISLNLRDDGESLLYHVGKFRHGKAHFSVGPFPHEWAFARTINPNRQVPWKEG